LSTAFEFDIADNKLKDVFSRRDFGLETGSPSKEINVSISEDKEVITGKIKKFVDQVNGVLSLFRRKIKLTKNQIQQKHLVATVFLETSSKD